MQASKLSPPKIQLFVDELSSVSKSGGVLSAAMAYKQTHERTTYGFEDVSYEYINLTMNVLI